MSSGTGLIGSSFALAIKAAGFTGHIFGVSSEASVRAALDRGAIDDARRLKRACRKPTSSTWRSRSAAFSTCCRWWPEYAKPDALVTDAGSTKRRIVERATECFGGKLFLGGHPMAGKEARGAAAADPDLFRDRPYFLTAARPETPAHPRVAEFVRWLARIGARPVLLSAEEHDRSVAATSHLPQMLSTALAGLLAQQPNAKTLAESGGPGLADMTRLALSAHDIWADILATNGDEIDRLLELTEAKIREIRNNLADSRQAFEDARSFAERVPRRTV